MSEVAFVVIPLTKIHIKRNKIHENPKNLEALVLSPDDKTFAYTADLVVKEAKDGYKQ